MVQSAGSGRVIVSSTPTLNSLQGQAMTKTNNSTDKEFLEPFQPFVGKLVIWKDGVGRNMWNARGDTRTFFICGGVDPGDLFVVLSLKDARYAGDGDVSQILILHPKFGAGFIDAVYPDNLSIVSTNEESNANEPEAA